jgi:hypothetical protein
MSSHSKMFMQAKSTPGKGKEEEKELSTPPLINVIEDLMLVDERLHLTRSLYQIRRAKRSHRFGFLQPAFIKIIFGDNLVCKPPPLKLHWTINITQPSTSTVLETKSGVLLSNARTVLGWTLSCASASVAMATDLNEGENEIDENYLKFAPPDSPGLVGDSEIFERRIKHLLMGSYNMVPQQSDEFLTALSASVSNPTPETYASAQRLGQALSSIYSGGRRTVFELSRDVLVASSWVRPKCTCCASKYVTTFFVTSLSLQPALVDAKIGECVEHVSESGN